jgi:hypothetical protein
VALLSANVNGGVEGAGSSAVATTTSRFGADRPARSTLWSLCGQNVEASHRIGPRSTLWSLAVQNVEIPPRDGRHSTFCPA